MITVSPWIQTTDACNLSCSYCYVDGSAVMGQDVYDAISKKLPASNTHIRIAGGEPLLVYNNWSDWCLQWATAEVLTNFRVIPNGYFDLPVRTSVSIDGYGEKILDKEMIGNLSKLKTTPWIMTTLAEIGNLPLLAYFIAENKYGWSISTDYFWDGKPHWDDLLLAMHEVIGILRAKDYDFAMFGFNNLDFSNRGGCQAGTSMFSIACDGKIYPCQTLQGQPGESTGDIFTGWIDEPCRCTEPPVCKECSIKGTCTGWCPLYHRPGNPLCDVMKYVAQEVLYAK